MKEISSTSNNLIKLIRSLKLAKHRKEHGLFVIEGERIVEEAVTFAQTEYLIYSKSYLEDKDIADTDNSFVVSESIFESLCDTKSPQGILAVMKIKECSKDIDSGIVIALEDVQDPLNVGAIIRTADALGARGVILSGECADIYSPKVLRGTMGSVFHLPIIKVQDFYYELKGFKSRGFKLVAGDLCGKDVERVEGNCVIIVGNEGNGISDQTRDICDVLWRLNMNGKAESLNASVALGIMLYTALN